MASDRPVSKYTEPKSVTIEKVHNGYLVSHHWDMGCSKGVARDFKEAQEMARKILEGKKK